MIPPIFTKLFDKFSISNTKNSSPSTKSKNSTKGNNSPITNNITTNVYDQSFNKPETLNKAPKQTIPTPIEILEDIKSRPPYQMDEAAEHYIGLTVTWKVRLASIKKYDDILRVISRYGEGRGVVVIMCEIIKKQYPKIETMPEDEEFYINGIIGLVDSYIDIKDSKLIFVD